MKNNKTLVLFPYDWDRIEFRKLSKTWPHLRAGFDLFSFPSNVRLAWFDMERFSSLAASRARMQGARAVVSNHDQFGALCAALVAEKMGWPGTSVEAVLACQHKLYTREVLDRVAPEANVLYSRLEADFDAGIPDGLEYPTFAKPVKAAFSVLARVVESRQELFDHTRFSSTESWILRHLVEPFDKVVRRRLPAAGTAHSLMLEEILRGRQYCLDGYCFDGKVHCLGVVDAIMYPGTDAFMRWDYPSQLPGPMLELASNIATRFMREIGFTHGFFNMEFVIDEHTGELKIIEFNPRMASQFSDLYARVDGRNLHEMVLALGQGIDPATLPSTEPTAACASSFVYRSFDPDASVPMPNASALSRFSSAFPDGLLLQFPKLPSEIQRDFKWLGSYRYGIVHLGGQSPADLALRCEQASSLLGWAAPTIKYPADLPGFPEPTTVGAETVPR